MAAEGEPCSVVLEGGVTSAVLYTRLLARLAEGYSLRQLGGTSSGAAAAAAGAAAEFGRLASGSNQPFDSLAAFPANLAETRRGRTRLERLFQPTSCTAGGLAIGLAALDRSGSDGRLVKVCRIVGAVLWHFPFATLLATLAFLAVAAVLSRLLPAWKSLKDAADHLAVVVVAVVVVLLLACAIGALLAWVLHVTLRGLRANHWGLCSGMPVRESDQNVLTPKLDGLYQGLSGLPKDKPLTFGHLWRGPGGAPSSGKRCIDLQVITTVVNLQRPLRLPGDPGSEPLHRYFYDPKEWCRLFPKDVMAHLKLHARPVELEREHGAKLLALPDMAQLPVLVAVRLSLSFPILLSAVPMYVAVPRADVLSGKDRTALPFEARKVYFTDGGITSNCPVHLFDAPLPGFPTFSVNLFSLKSGCTRVSRSDRHDPELDAAAIDDAAAWRSPLPLLRGMLDTTLGWRDSLQRSLPGYRERVVHIGLPKTAGGLNLAMRPRTIRRLERVGLVAAERLLRDFNLPRRPGEPNAWERHRWTRARSTLSALHDYLGRFADRLSKGSPDYARLLATATPAHFPFDDETARRQALTLAAQCAALMAQVDATRPPDAMDRHAPEPQPQLHISPPW